MPSGDEFIRTLHGRFAENPTDWRPSEEDVAAARQAAVAEGSSFYNDAGSELARGYVENRYSFDFCDTLVNSLFLIWTTDQRKLPRPELFLRVYEAFDAGEYHRRADKSDDPVAEHTDPAIKRIVGSL